jgi:hypothetical protein
MKKVLLIAVLVVIVGCNKEKQALKKIYGGYVLKAYTVDGVDSLNLSISMSECSFNFYKEQHKDVNTLKINGIREDQEDLFVICEWEYSYKEETIISSPTPTNNAGTGPFGPGKTSVWKILKLTSSEIEMSTLYNNKEHWIDLHPSRY